MIRLILLTVAAFFTILTVLFYLALRYLPAWGIVLAALVCAAVAWAGIKLFSKRLLTSLLLIPFKAKGACLRNAAVTVHSVDPAEPPPPDESGPAASMMEEDPRSGRPVQHYSLDVTITPQPVATPFQFWEPSEMMMMPYQERIRLDDEQDETVRIIDHELLQNGNVIPDDSGKYHGPLRLRLLVAVPEGVRRLKFRYYFEAFGDVALPAPSSGSTGSSATSAPAREA